MGMHLNTGDTGFDVTAEDDGGLYSGIFGCDCYVLQYKDQFKAEIQNNNTIKISSGEAMIQGRHVFTSATDSDLVTINNGSSGKNRIDLIVIRYEKNTEGVESAKPYVIQGTESTGTPTVPYHVDGDILTGATTKDMPLYEVELSGINIIAVRPLFTVVGNITELERKYNELNSSMQDINQNTYLKFQSPSGQNLTYGCWVPGIYPYGGYSDGAPSNYAGAMLVLLDGNRNYIKIAFAGSADIYVMTQDSTGNILTGWRTWTHS